MTETGCTASQPVHRADFTFDIASERTQIGGDLLPQMVALTVGGADLANLRRHAVDIFRRKVNFREHVKLVPHGIYRASCSNNGIHEFRYLIFVHARFLFFKPREE